MRDSRGNTIALATVSVFSFDGNVGGTDQADENGRYALSGLRPGRNQLNVYLGRTAPPLLETQIELREGHTVYDIVTR